jgi:hypothetical protein
MVKLKGLPNTPKPSQERDEYLAQSNLVNCYFSEALLQANLSSHTSWKSPVSFSFKMR